MNDDVEPGYSSPLGATIGPGDANFSCPVCQVILDFSARVLVADGVTPHAQDVADFQGLMKTADSLASRIRRIWAEPSTGQ
jgi:hypothetical protein